MKEYCINIQLGKIKGKNEERIRKRVLSKISKTIFEVIPWCIYLSSIREETKDTKKIDYEKVVKEFENSSSHGNFEIKNPTLNEFDVVFKCGYVYIPEWIRENFDVCDIVVRMERLYTGGFWTMKYRYEREIDIRFKKKEAIIHKM